MSIPEVVVRESLLTEGLVGPYRHLYHDSASFRAAVKTLARMLPLMVDGLATAAELERGRQRERAGEVDGPAYAAEGVPEVRCSRVHRVDLYL